MSPSGYRSPTTSHRGAPPLATERSRQAWEARQRRAAQRAIREVRSSQPRKDEQLDFDEQGSTVGFKLRFDEEQDADEEVELIAERGNNRGAAPSAGRPRSRASPAYSEAHGNHFSSRTTPAQSPHFVGVAPFRDIPLSSMRTKEVWVEILEERRKQWKERCVIFRNMRKMPFSEWDKKKDLVKVKEAEKEKLEHDKSSPSSSKGFGGLQFSFGRP